MVTTYPRVIGGRKKLLSTFGPLDGHALQTDPGMNRARSEPPASGSSFPPSEARPPSYPKQLSRQLSRFTSQKVRLKKFQFSSLSAQENELKI
jgi:hypothetical protein